MMNTIKKVIIFISIVIILVSICTNVLCTSTQENWPTANAIPDHGIIANLGTSSHTINFIALILAVINIIIIIKYRKVIENKILKLFFIGFLVFLPYFVQKEYVKQNPFLVIPLSALEIVSRLALIIIPIIIQMVMPIILIKTIKKNKNNKDERAD